MKSFVVAVILLALVILLTVVIAFLVNDRIQTLISLGESHRCEEALEELIHYEPLLSLSVHHILLESLQTAAEEMCIYPTDTPEYLAARERFLSGCREVLAGEKITFFNVF